MSDVEGNSFAFDGPLLPRISAKYGPVTDPWDPQNLGDNTANLDLGRIGDASQSIGDELMLRPDVTDEGRADPNPIEGVTLGNDVVEAEALTMGRGRRVMEWVRRNKATTFAGGVLVGSFVANPLGKGLEQLDWSIGAKVLGAVAIAEVFWIGGAAVAWKAAGGKFTLNPFKIKQAFSGLSRQTVKDNRALFDAGVMVNTAAAVTQMAVPSAAIVANLPPTYWGLVGLAGLELWATFKIRRKIYDVASGPKPTVEPTID